MDENEDVLTDPLFAALTRPATIGGVPFFAVCIAAIFTAVIFLAIGNPLYILLYVPIHTVLYVLSANDPGKFSALYIWVQTIGKCSNRNHWKCASFSPLRKDRIQKY